MSANAPPVTCATCKYSGVMINMAKTLTHICRKRPPQTASFPMGATPVAGGAGAAVQWATSTSWPTIRVDQDWCGEHTPVLTLSS